MSRLWEFDEFGEPWLENGSRNPPLLIVNQVHKKGKKRMAKRRQPAALRKYWATHRKSRSNRKHSPKRRRRSNPWPVGGVVAQMNRKRGRKRGRKHASRRKSYRRNPAILGITLPPLQSVIYAGVGFVGVPLMEGFLTRFLPVSLTSSTIGKYVTRIASVLGLSYLTRLVIGSSESRMVAIGGGAYVMTTAISEFAPGIKEALGLSSYSPATTLGAYAASTSRTFNQLGAPNFGAQNTPRSAPFGGSRIVATRFRRFQ